MTRDLRTAALLVSLLVASLAAAQTLRIEYPPRRVTLPKEVIEVELPDHVHPIPQTLPTAEELSADWALQRYVIESLKATGHCNLPPGVIRISEPLTLRWVHGGTIEGAGPAYAGADSDSDWRRAKKVIQANTVIVTSDPSRPVVDLSAIIGLEVANVAIESTGVGIKYRDEPGGGSMNNTLRRVAFLGNKIGFKAGEKITDPNAADVTFTGCTWHRCETCFESNHNQGVNYVFDGLCFARECDVFAMLRGGGVADLQHVEGMNVGTWLVILAGGGNTAPSTIARLYSDRTKDFPPPVIVDAARAMGHFSVDVTAPRITYHGKSDGEKFPGWVAFRLPANYAATNSRINVDRPETVNWPAGVIAKPTVVEVTP